MILFFSAQGERENVPDPTRFRLLQPWWLESHFLKALPGASSPQLLLECALKFMLIYDSGKFQILKPSQIRRQSYYYFQKASHISGKVRVGITITQLHSLWVSVSAKRTQIFKERRHVNNRADIWKESVFTAAYTVLNPCPIFLKFHLQKIALGRQNTSKLCINCVQKFCCTFPKYLWQNCNFYKPYFDDI